MDKVEKIKEWVKKQKKETLARNSIGVIIGKAIFVDANELLSFIDSLSEEPDKSLEEAAKQFVGYDMDTDDLRDYEAGIQAFIAGANWKEEQMLKKAIDGEISSIDVGDDSYVKTIKMLELQKVIRTYNLGDRVRVVILKGEED